MTALNKQALRMRNYLDTAFKSGVKLLHLSTDELKGLLDDLETKEEQRANWFQMAQKLGEDLDAAEKRIAELEARKLTVNLPAACADDEYFIDGVFQPLRYERDVERALRAAGIGVKDE